MGAARTTLPKNTITVRAKSIKRPRTLTRPTKTCVMAAVVKNAIVA
jgi:hypothetical protein